MPVYVGRERYEAGVMADQLNSFSAEASCPATDSAVCICWTTAFSIGSLLAMSMFCL